MGICYETQGAQPGARDDLEGRTGEVGGKLKKEETYVYLQLIHIVIWQKSKQHVKPSFSS